MVQMEKETKVGVMFSGKMTVCSVTKYTTCDDVTEMVLYSSFNSTHFQQHGLFETAYGVERMLAGKSSILKVIRSWGSKKGDVSLLVKQVDNVVQKKIKISKAKKRLEKIRSILSKNRTDDTMDNNLENNIHKTQMYDKRVEIVNNDITVSKSGKVDLMKRYLDDIFSHATNTTYSERLKDEEDSCSDSDVTCIYDSGLDTAFIGEHCDMFDMTRDELNDCMISDCSDTESAFYESCISDSKLERNVFEDDVIENAEDVKKLRDLFGKVGIRHNSSYDKAIESFMSSLVCCHDNDEGISSMGSDV